MQLQTNLKKATVWSFSGTLCDCEKIKSQRASVLPYMTQSEAKLRACLDRLWFLKKKKKSISVHITYTVSVPAVKLIMRYSFGTNYVYACVCEKCCLFLLMYFFCVCSVVPQWQPCRSICLLQRLPAAIPSAASKMHMTPEGWPANELLINTETLTQRGFNNASIKEKELLRVLQETNHQTHGFLKTKDAKLVQKTFMWAEVSASYPL